MTQMTQIGGWPELAPEDSRDGSRQRVLPRIPRMTRIREGDESRELKTSHPCDPCNPWSFPDAFSAPLAWDLCAPRRNGRLDTHSGHGRPGDDFLVLIALRLAHLVYAERFNRRKRREQRSLPPFRQIFLCSLRWLLFNSFPWFRPTAGLGLSVADRFP